MKRSGVCGWLTPKIENLPFCMEGQCTIVGQSTSVTRKEVTWSEQDIPQLQLRSTFHAIVGSYLRYANVTLGSL